MKKPVINEEDVIGFEAIWDSIMKCRKGVTWKGSVAHIVLNALHYASSISKSLKDGTYEPKPVKKFKIGYPKAREIQSVHFEDRVYHRSLSDNALYPQIAPSLIYDNCSCQTNKGTDFARERLKCFLQRHYRKHGCEGYVAQYDIKGYYPNMQHAAVDNLFDKRLDKWTYNRVIDTLESQFPTEVGYIPGSQIVQIIGISLLDSLDHFIKERLLLEYYIRYMDDFLALHRSKTFLESRNVQIIQRIGDLGFAVNPKKTALYPIKDGIDFLGFKFVLTNTGKVLMLLDYKNVKHEKSKLIKLVSKAKNGEIPVSSVEQSYQGWRAHAIKGNNNKIVRNMDEFYRSIWQ